MLKVKFNNHSTIVTLDTKLAAKPVSSSMIAEVSDLSDQEMFSLVSRIFKIELSLRVKEAEQEFLKCSIQFLQRLIAEFDDSLPIYVNLSDSQKQLKKDLRIQVRNLVTAFRNVLVTYKAVPINLKQYVLISDFVVNRMCDEFKLTIGRMATRVLNDSNLIHLSIGDKSGLEKKLQKLMKRLEKPKAVDLSKGIAAPAEQATTNKMAEAIKNEKQATKVQPRILEEGSLIQACYLGDLDAVKQYMKTHTKKTLRFMNATADTDFLHLFEDPEHPSIVDEYMSPFHICCLKGHDHIAKFLLENKYADINRLSQIEKNGTRHNAWSALHLAVRSGNDVLVAYLCKSGLDINARGEYGITPLHLATYHQYYSAVKCLLAAGALVNAQTENHGATPLHNAAAHDDSDTITLLLTQPTCLANIEDKNHWTPLRYAIEACHESSIVAFLRQGYCLPEVLLNEYRKDFHDKKNPDDHPFMSYQLATMTYVTQATSESVYKPLAMDFENDDDDNNNVDKDADVNDKKPSAAISGEVEEVFQSNTTVSVHVLELK